MKELARIWLLRTRSARVLHATFEDAWTRRRSDCSVGFRTIHMIALYTLGVGLVFLRGKKKNKKPHVIALKLTIYLMQRNIRTYLPFAHRKGMKAESTGCCIFIQERAKLEDTSTPDRRMTMRSYLTLEKQWSQAVYVFRCESQRYPCRTLSSNSPSKTKA